MRALRLPPEGPRAERHWNSGQGQNAEQGSGIHETPHPSLFHLPSILLASPYLPTICFSDFLGPPLDKLSLLTRTEALVAS